MRRKESQEQQKLRKTKRQDAHTLCERRKRPLATSFVVLLRESTAKAPSTKREGRQLTENMCGAACIMASPFGAVFGRESSIVPSFPFRNAKVRCLPILRLKKQPHTGQWWCPLGYGLSCYGILRSSLFMRVAYSPSQARRVPDHPFKNGIQITVPAVAFSVNVYTQNYPLSP